MYTGDALSKRKVEPQWSDHQRVPDLPDNNGEWTAHTVCVWLAHVCVVSACGMCVVSTCGMCG